ncbi:MAG: GAF domain-containing sensor histidine kinase [Planctomycetes bacterium]|nr:GAF domain-containing sensor histidine kinase [Planctomycetota bacterium]
MGHDSFPDRLRDVRTPQKIEALALRELASRLDARIDVRASWDRAALTLDPPDAFTADAIQTALARRGPGGRRDVLILELAVDERHARLVRLERPGRPFHPTEVETARQILSRAERELEERASEQRRAVVERTYARLLRRLRGRDLHYRVLHAMRDLIAYDHSGAFLVYDDHTGTLSLQAEQVSWTKGKSRRIGTVIGHAATTQALALPEEEPVLIRDQAVVHPEGLALHVPEALLGYHGEDGERPRPRSAILAALHFEGHCLGVLAAFGRHPHSLSTLGCRHLKPLLPMAAIAVHHQVRDLGLERAFLEEQKKHAIAEMARGVAHDINNSLMVLLPRAQMLREALQRSPATPPRQLEDAELVERHAHHAQRIFRGMLSYARRGAAPTAAVSLYTCARNVLDLLGPTMQEAGIELIVTLEDTSPVEGNAQQLERVFHNLLQNARQASASGDRIVVALRQRGTRVRFLVLNKGRAVPRPNRRRVFEPFFSTRPGGQGLGLSLSRSIIVEHGGAMRLLSRDGCGTLVSLTLPRASS